MRRLSKKFLLLLILIEIVFGVVLIFSTTKATEVASKILLVATIIDFIALTFTVQALGYKSFSAKKIKYPTMDYKSDYDFEELDKILIENSFKNTKRRYGNSYLLIDGKTAIKVTLIEDYLTYFDTENNNDSEAKANKDLDKCEKFIGIEIFKEVDEANLDKIPLFTIQGKNVYFTALLYQGLKKYKCLNYELPEEAFIESFNKALDILKIKEEDDLNVEQ